MKILSVRFKNLNSLVGEWFIDFTDPHYSTNGIFAIVGATGAGKTTILDAISLGLYGRTPRLDRISKSQNDLMSRQTGECSSEVEFLTAKGHFRTHWSQHRARKTKTGELQPPRHEFADETNGKLVSTKIKEVAAAVISATGMTFDQFTRSMLLAQGEFSKFLSADADQRAPILEQITGTEIYSRISQQVHRHTAEEKSRYENLKQLIGSYNLLTDEELQTCTNRQEKLNVEVNAIQTAIADCNQVIHWQQNIQTLTRELTAKQTELSKLQVDWKNLLPKREKLLLDQKCNPLRERYTQLEQLRLLQQKEQQQFDLLLPKRTKVEDDLTLLQQSLKTEELQLIGKKDSQKKTQTVIKEVLQLDFLSEQKLLELKQLKKSITLASDNQAALVAKESQLLKLRETTSSDISRLKEYQTLNSKDGTLQEPLAALKEKSAGFETINKKLAQQLQSLSRLSLQITEIEAENSNLATLQETAEKEQQKTELLLKAKDTALEQLTTKNLPQLYQSYQTEKDSLTALQLLDTLLRNLAVQHAKLAKDLEDEKALTADLEAVNRDKSFNLNLCKLQRKNVTKQEEIYLLANKVEGFDKEREKLQQNAPCPLCGSTDHPYRTDTPTNTKNAQSELQKEKELLNKVEQERQSLEKKSVTLEQMVKTCHKLQENTRSAVTGLETQIKELCTKHNIARQNRTEEFTGPEIISKEIKISELDAQIKLVEALTNEKITLQQQQQNLAAKSRKAEQDSQLKQHQLAALFAEQKQLESVYQTTQLELDTLTRAMVSLIRPYTDSEISTQTIDKIIGEFETRLQQWNENKNSLELWEQKLQKIEHDFAQLHLSGEHLTQQINSHQEKIANVEPDLQAAKNRRIALFGNHNPEQVEKELDQELAQLQDKIEAKKLNAGQLEQELATLAERRKGLSSSISSRKADLIKQQEQFITEIRTLGLDSEELFFQAILTDEKRQSYQLQVDETSSRVTSAVAASQSLKERLATEQEKELSEVAETDVKKQLANLNEQLDLIQRERGALANKLETHNQVQKEQQEKLVQLDKQYVEYQHWQQLHTLIGSADGKKFRNFAQGLTFEQMIVHANRTLLKMSDRYLLTRSRNHPLELNVIDGYQAGEIRSTANLSGGESFIISLSLALALSSMSSSKVQVDSLFLDEGFGTLDEESLEIALETLSNLQQDGKLIGIISHVPMLKERIAVQLQLTSRLDGTSQLQGPGVYQKGQKPATQPGFQ